MSALNREAELLKRVALLEEAVRVLLVGVPKSPYGEPSGLERFRVAYDDRRKKQRKAEFVKIMAAARKNLGGDNS